MQLRAELIPGTLNGWRAVDEAGVVKAVFYTGEESSADCAGFVDLKNGAGSNRTITVTGDLSRMDDRAIADAVFRAISRGHTLGAFIEIKGGSDPAGTVPALDSMLGGSAIQS